MIGTSVSGLITIFQAEANDLLKETDGDIGQIVSHMMAQLQQQELISAQDSRQLRESFAEALDVLAGKASADTTLASSRARVVSLAKASDSTDVAKVLAELCHSVVADAAIMPRITGGAVSAGPENAGIDSSKRGESLPPIVAATVSGKGPQALLWGAVGAYVGGSIGGPLGAVIGAGVGAAVGACGDSDTTITPTNNGGSPA